VTEILVELVRVAARSKLLRIPGVVVYDDRYQFNVHTPESMMDMGIYIPDGDSCLN
jgi:hypothetical protein